MDTTSFNLSALLATFQNTVQAINNLSQTVSAVFPPPFTSSATYDPPSIADSSSAITPVTVVGAALNDYVTAAFSLDLQGLVLTAYISAPDTATVVFSNLTGAPVDLGSGTITVWVRSK